MIVSACQIATRAFGSGPAGAIDTTPPTQARWRFRVLCGVLQQEVENETPPQEIGNGAIAGLLDEDSESGVGYCCGGDQEGRDVDAPPWGIEVVGIMRFASAHLKEPPWNGTHVAAQLLPHFFRGGPHCLCSSQELLIARGRPLNIAGIATASLVHLSCTETEVVEARTTRSRGERDRRMELLFPKIKSIRPEAPW